MIQRDRAEGKKIWGKVGERVLADPENMASWIRQ